MDAKNYTGSIDAYNFQNQNLTRLTYANGILTNTLPLAHYTKQAVKVSTGGELKANVECIITIIFDAIWDWIVNTFSGGGDVGGGGGDFGSYMNSYGYNASDYSGYGFTSGDGSGGGSTWGPPPCPPSSQGGASINIKINNLKVNKEDPHGNNGCSVNNNGGWTQFLYTTNDLIYQLINSLSITDVDKQNFLNNNTSIALQLYSYLQQQGNTQDNITIAKNYIDNLIGDANYLSFVRGHSNTGSVGTVWWLDNSWLENVNNFSLNFDSELYDIYQRLNPQEKVILALYPYQGYLISKNKPIAENEAITRHPSSTALNDKTDAFRHAFFNAMNERDCGTSMFGLGGSIAKLYSDAHESNTPPELNIEKQMDIHNNTVGQSLLHQSPSLSSTDNSSLSNAVETALVNGQLVYLSPLDLSLPRGIISGTTHITPTNQ